MQYFFFGENTTRMHAQLLSSLYVFVCARARVRVCACVCVGIRVDT